MFNNYLRPAIVSFAALTVLTGIAYPLVTTGAAQALFPHQANGSLIKDAFGKVIGSSLIGQPFSDPKHFWSRPSATTPAVAAAEAKAAVPATATTPEVPAVAAVAATPAAPYDPQASVGTNKTPVGDEFLAALKANVDALKKADPDNALPIPQDLVTASASGLDPHISPEAAAYQVHRIAKARGMSEDAVKALVAAHTEQPQLGILGMPRVNVLELNLALDAAK